VIGENLHFGRKDSALEHVSTTTANHCKCYKDNSYILQELLGRGFHLFVVVGHFFLSSLPYQYAPTLSISFEMVDVANHQSYGGYSTLEALASAAS